jgi:hypothetical protein
MATKLPTREDLAQATPSATRQISTYQTGQVARAMTGFGETMGNVVQMIDKEQDRMDDIRAEDALNKAKLKALELSDGENGYTKMKGSDVVGNDVRGDYTKRFDKAMDSIASTLTNPRQIERFRRRTGGLNVSYQGSLLNHIGSETKSYQDSTDIATVEIETQQAAAEWTNPQSVLDSKARIMYTLNSKAERDGLSAEAKKSLVNDTMTELHTGVIGAMIESDIEKAKEYYKSNKKEINGTDRVTLEDALNKGSVKAESQMKSDEIMGKDLSINESLKEARKIKDAETREATVSLVKERHNEKKLVQAEAVTEVGKYVAQNKTMDGISPEIMDALPADKVVSMQNTARELREGIEPIQDHKVWAEYNNLVGRASAGDKAAINELYSKDVFNDLYMKLDNSHFDQALTMQRAFVTNDAKAKQKAGSTAGQVLTNKASADNYINQILGVKKTAGKGGRSEQGVRFADEFYQLAQTAIDQWSIDNPNKKIPPAERDAIFRNLSQTLTVEDAGFMWFDKDYTVADIPPKHINTIAADLKAGGYQLTGQNLINEYLARKEQGLID